MTAAPIRLLYVDDYPLDRALVREALYQEPETFELTEATSRNEFFALLGVQRYDVVLSDFNILGFTGLQVLDAVQEHLPGVPVVIVTGTGSEEVAAEAIKRGAADYVVKGERSLRRLPHIIHQVMERHRAETEKAATLTALRESESRYRLLFGSVPVGIWLVDRHGTVRESNPAMDEITGYSMADLQSVAICEMCAEVDDSARVREALESGEERTDWEISLRRAGGNHFDALLNLSTVEWNGEGFSLMTVRDISGRRSAERALEQEAARRRSLWEQSPDGILILDPDTARFLDFNTAAHRQLGYTREEFAQLTVMDVESTETVEETLRHISSVFTDGRIDFETVQQTKQGELRNTLVTAHLVMVLGRPIYQCIWRDITDRKRAEVALRESEERYRALFENVSVGVSMIGPNMEILALNRRMREWFPDIDPERQPICYRAFNSPPRDECCWYCPTRLTLADGQWHEAVTETPTPDGIRYYRVASTALFDLHGSVVAAIEMVDDITEQKQAEDDLRESARELLEAQRLAHIGSWTYDPAMQHPTWSEEMFRIWGLTPAQGTPSYADHEKYIHPDDFERFDHAASEALTQATPYQLELRIRRPDGEERTIVTICEPQVDSQGRVVQLKGTNQDITDRKRVEDALRESEEKYRQLVENLNDVIYTLDLSGAFTYVSPVIERFSAYKVGDLIGKPFADFVHPDDLPRLPEGKRRTLRGEVEPLEYRILDRDGSVRHIRSSSRLLYQDGVVVGITGVMADVSQRVQAEAALRESEARFRSLFEQTAVGVALLETETGQYVAINQRYCDFLGYSMEDMLGMSFQDVTYADDAKANIDQNALLVAGKIKEYSIEKRYVRKDGSVVWGNLTASPLWKPGEKPITFMHIAVVEDITERKRAEAERSRLLERIQAQAQQIVQIMDTVPEGVLLLDADGHVLLANPAGERALALLAEVSIGDRLTHLGDRSLAELLTPPPAGLRHEVRAGTRTYEVSARRIVGVSEPGQWVFVIDDITEALMARDQLQRQDRLAAIGQLAAGIAHDFNNILAIISLQVPLLRISPALTDRDRVRLAVVGEQTAHAARLVKQLLDFGRRSVLERRTLDLGRLLSEQVDLLTRTLPENIRISLECDPGTHLIHADPTSIQQMVMNLAVNARDAMPRGGELHLTLSLPTGEQTQGPPGGPWVQLSISDTGTGLAPEARAHLFEPFFTTKEKGKGTGLGLAQVHGIVKQHGGEISVDSVAGRGAAFTIFLPCLAEDSSPDGISASVTEPTLGSQQTILIVEDNSILLDAMSDTIEALGYRVIGAGNGKEALEALAKPGETVALVLTDLVMPVMGGEDLLRSMRNRGLQTPVVILSGHPLDAEIEQLKTLGLTGWLLKPPNIDTLARLLAQTVSSPPK